MQLIAIITNVSTKSGKVPASSKVEPAVELSLLNSLIHGHRQKSIIEEESNEGITFYRLGLQRIEPKFKLRNMSTVDRYIVYDPLVRNYNALETLINELGISEFATLHYENDNMIFQSNLNFDYTKLRDMQNIDWAEESIKLGEKTHEQGGALQTVLKYYESAIGLDPLNKTAHVLKADTLMEMVTR